MRMLQGWPGRPAPRPPSLRRILVVPLLIKNPTSAGEQGEVVHDSDVVERKEIAAEPAVGVMTTRARSRRIAALALALPEEILVWEIFVRLPAKDIFRCRAVCRAWRGLASAADFLLAHHQRLPSLPLLTLYGSTSMEVGLPVLGRSCPVLGFDDYSLKIHASCDGLLLLSLHGRGFNICNPATRQTAPIPCISAAGHINIAAMYLHCPSWEYRILYREGRHYSILTVQPGSLPRCIGVPSDIPSSEKVLLTFPKTTPTTFAPPILFHSCLHWDPGCFRKNADIVVFDTVVESFSFMHSPAGATRFCTRLCDMEGSMGFSCFDDRKTTAKIWVLEDYERKRNFDLIQGV
ncbi:putative F-box protein At5g50220 [Lolium perenne]|uniref:putative F-box protein At5g50220 n=1 Tax=Lolium perenne TaxID=4522 RepID=UPI0021F67D8F|nr:uncharacterized protein LOC127304103 [Lolium perenne]